MSRLVSKALSAGTLIGRMWRKIRECNGTVVQMKDTNTRAPKKTGRKPGTEELCSSRYIDLDIDGRGLSEVSAKTQG
jgi:hypothetical protein